MPKNKRLLGILVSAFMAIQVPTLLAEGQELVLHTFTFHKDGAFPFAGVSFDSKGNLYGVSSEAGFDLPPAFVHVRIRQVTTALSPV